MITKKIGDFTGYSDSGIYEAVQNALEKAGEHAHFEVVETCCSQGGENDRQYQVTLTTFGE
ncbi:dodecin domain-containing protein [Legionella nagasakiensis]|uniref:dodecin domain-containing protein n=1 Tax=Legionella nagasakiensis TaxID=535290 RepID=UPI00105636C6|nr:dodecin domain-containing protein [Legionella nagasakiensis]